jgi:23S rRNA (pseudouridine1915-N3)-methyltransferase
MEKEGERLLARVPEGLDLIALTRHGTLMDTDQLAGYLHDHQIDSRAGVALVVGGAYGLAPSVLARARLRVSLSKMTLPHEMARLLVAEQLYRAGTIVRGEPYHKG